MIKITAKGSFNKTVKFLNFVYRKDFLDRLEQYGQIGVDALASATPVDTGKTAASWGYTVERTRDSVSIIWTNSNVESGVPIAILIQYGHGTRNGGYVEGRDYINPAIQPIFDKISEEIWKEVVNA